MIYEGHTMNETEIVQLAQQGDTHAFRQLFEDNKRRVFTLAFQYTKNKEDAEGTTYGFYPPSLPAVVR